MLNVLMTKLILILLLTLSLFSCNHQDDIPFDSNKWKNWVESESELRLRKDMLSDLLDKHNLIGISKEQLYTLLGPPSNLSENSYYIGYSKNWGISTISLVFYFDSDNKVIKHVESEG
jgi:hypothetical protein